jgi:diguanylate cyclase (GGDEF)-like protein
LTGIFNRRYFETQFERDLNIAQRNNQPLSLVLIDLDHFKSINDRLGHSVGDEVLRSVARLMKTCLRNFDTLARYGGEEFAVILPQTNMESAMIIAERLRSVIASAEIGYAGNVSASFGVATYPHHARSGDRLRVVADEYLYRAKRAGRNRVACPAETLAIDEDDDTLREIAEVVVAAELNQL